TQRGCIARVRVGWEGGLRGVTRQAEFLGAGKTRLPNTTLFAVPGVKAETAIIAFDLNGIAVSSGSACSSGKVQPSDVLAAMGVDATIARGAIRASLGNSTTEADVDRVVQPWNTVAGSLLKERSGVAA